MIKPAPPVADQRPHASTHHGITVEDPYHWLKDQGYPDVTDTDVLDYLKAENAYFASVMAPYQNEIDDLFEEIKARQKPDDASVPLKDGAYYYQWSFEADGQYRVWSRWPLDDEAAKTVILDEPALAEAHEYFRLGAMSISPDGRYMAYSTDTSGAERFEMRIQDLQTGEIFAEVIENTLGSPEWANDNKTLFYTVANENWRPYRALRHTVGTSPDDDEVIFEEQDDGFFVDVSKTSSEAFIIVSTGTHVTDERYLIPADQPDAEPRLVAGRRTHHEYDIDHQGDRFVVLTNDTHKNFRLAVAPGTDPGEANWQTLIEGSNEHFLRGMHCFDAWIVVQQRTDGLDQVRLIDRAGQSAFIEFPEAAYSAGVGANAEYDVAEIRLAYTSMVTPNTVYDYDFKKRKLLTRKVQEIPSGYDASSYHTERRMAPARDGVEVPVSIVYRKDTPLDGTAPLYLYGYGAYGHAMSPSFSTTRLSLLDRGFIYAIAHIRGGDDLGYHWYEDGKLDKRTNTFNDFVDVARFLVAENYVQTGRIVIAGGSAGGELMGAAANMAPQLWGAIAAHVPFVDVLNTMLDTSLPLTPIEWPEWGNPIEDKAAFEYIRSYSPYDQLSEGNYPPMLVTAGLNDPRVTYWEPAKYVAKLRTLKTDDNVLLLKTNMDAGHGGKSGRYDSLYEVAEEYAFMLMALAPQRI
ncbi:MAG: S9 family peptidase [Gammaproteobacteria bacterium]|nr:S9 family peptidase [Gammaproteobacteria bacterium]